MKFFLVENPHKLLNIVLARQGMYLEKKLICQEVSGSCIDFDSFKDQPTISILVITSTRPRVDNLLCLIKTFLFLCTSRLVGNAYEFYDFI